MLTPDFIFTFRYTFNNGQESAVFNTTTVTTTEAVPSALKSLRARIVANNDAGVKSVIGIDVSHNGDSVGFDGVKLATATAGVVIDTTILHCGLNDPHIRALSRFFAAPDVTFVGVGIKHSVDALATYGIRCRNFVDLGALAAELLDDKRLEGSGSIDLARRICNLKVKARVRKAMNVAMFDRDMTMVWDAKANRDDDDAEFSSEWLKSSVVINAHIAFMVGNSLLGGVIPYAYDMYQQIV